MILSVYGWKRRRRSALPGGDDATHEIDALAYHVLVFSEPPDNAVRLLAKVLQERLLGRFYIRDIGHVLYEEVVHLLSLLYVEIA